MAKRIIALLPATGYRFVDVFAGRGNISWAVMQDLDYEKFWLNDLQTRPFLNGLKQSHKRAIPEVSRQDASLRELHERMKQRHSIMGRKFPYGDGMYGDSVSALFAPLLNFSGNSYDGGGTRSKKRGGVSSQTFEKNVRGAHALMMRYKPRLSQLDYRKVLSVCNDRNMVYLDPPYLGFPTRSYPSNIDYAEMVELLKHSRFPWLLSEFRHPLYLKAFGEPFHIIKRSMAGCTGTAGRKQRQVEECFWKHF
jgi:site-specific DNA-adenine methylase